MEHRTQGSYYFLFFFGGAELCLEPRLEPRPELCTDAFLFPNSEMISTAKIHIVYNSESFPFKNVRQKFQGNSMECVLSVF